MAVGPGAKLADLATAATAAAGIIGGADRGTALAEGIASGTIAVRAANNSGTGRRGPQSAKHGVNAEQMRR